MRAVTLAYVLVLTMLGCATTKPDQMILAADRSVTVVLTSTDSALNAKLISSSQAQSVSTIAHQVNPLLDSARAAYAAGDTAGATKTMNLVNALLAGLNAYVPPPAKP
jgi:predicted component of type VI protein secretion system